MKTLSYYRNPEVAATYDKSRYSSRAGKYSTRREIGMVVEELQGLRTVLDIGAGTGRICDALAPYYDVVATDGSLEMVRYCDSPILLHDLTLSGYLPFLGQSFDVVIASKVMNHLPMLQPLIVEEMVRVAATKIIITVPMWGGWPGKIEGWLADAGCEVRRKGVHLLPVNYPHFTFPVPLFIHKRLDGFFPKLSWVQMLIGTRC